MFLIDNDQPEVAKRQEQRRPGADDQPDLARTGHVPQPPPLGPRYAGMPFAGPRAEPRLDPVQKLSRKRDFRQQHQGLPPRLQAGGHGLQIDLGLARPGDAAQKRRAISPAADRRPQRLGGHGLIRRQRLSRQVRVKPGIGHVLRRAHLDQRSRRDQTLDHADPDAGQLRQLRRRETRPAVIVDDPQHRRTRLGHPGRLRPGAQDDAPLGGRPVQVRRPHRHAQHHRQRRQRVFGGPAQEIAQLIRQRRGIDAAQDRAQFGQIEGPFARPPDHAHHPARSQRADHDLALGHAALWRQIVQQPHGFGGQHPDACALSMESHVVQPAFKRSPADLARTRPKNKRPRLSAVNRLRYHRPERI